MLRFDIFMRLLGMLKFCLATVGAKYFSCVASAAHFLFYQ